MLAGLHWRGALPAERRIASDLEHGFPIRFQKPCGEPAEGERSLKGDGSAETLGGWALQGRWLTWA